MPQGAWSGLCLGPPRGIWLRADDMGFLGGFSLLVAVPGGAWLSACTHCRFNRPAAAAGSSLNFDTSKEPGAPQTGQAPTTEPLGGDFGGRRGAAAPGVAIVRGNILRVTPILRRCHQRPPHPPCHSRCGYSCTRGKPAHEKKLFWVCFFFKKNQQVFAKSRGTTQPDIGTAEVR